MTTEFAGVHWNVYTFKGMDYPADRPLFGNDTGSNYGSTNSLYSGCLFKKMTTKGHSAFTFLLFSFAHSKPYRARTDAIPFPSSFLGTSVCMSQIISSLRRY